jgi:hypothetical protein
MSTDHSMADQPQRSQRGRLLLLALVYSGLFLACVVPVGIAVYHITNGRGGYIVMLVVFTFLSLLFGYWAYHYLRDLGAQPVVVEGSIQRRWHQGSLLFFFFPSYYIRVEGQVFGIPKLAYAMLFDSDTLRITCYPHSLMVETVERYDETEKQYVPAERGALD